ncbi:MAG: imelysin family protein [Oricola sp.]
MRLTAILLAGIMAFAAVPAHALTVGDAEAIEPVKRVIAGFIQPEFSRFAENAELASVAVSTLCEQPSERRLGSARQAFRDSALSFARIEFLRTGPLAKDNRLERLLFWPDRKGVALRQVQAAIATGDESVTDAAALPAKSVALQGFTALEYLLFGTGSDEMAKQDGQRCAFAAAVAGNIHSIAEKLAAEWNDPQGYAAIWAEPGPDNEAFRNVEEAVGELISIPSEAFEIIRDQRLKPILPEDGEPNRKQALFWRSGLTMEFAQAGFEALRAYFEASQMGSLLTDDERWQTRSIEFEFGNAERTFERLGLPIEDVLADPDRTKDLQYLVILSQSLQRMFGEQLTATLGLSVGFSSLDGD